MLLLSLVSLATLSSVLAAPSSYGVQVRAGAPSVAAWYPAWLGSNWPPSKIPWGKYTTMKFAFAYVCSPLKLTYRKFIHVRHQPDYP